jgi:flagellin-like hook-associated protein FlgL
MSISVNTNAAATTARNHLLHSHEALGKNIQRLSSGKRLNNSAMIRLLLQYQLS